MRNLLCLVISLALLGVSLAYPSYQDIIPNGNNVNHPCKVNYRWPGLGHLNPLGGGERNPFGEDFSRLGRTWNTALCQLDSDGDGLTNGQELGDPQCTWTPGQTALRTGITHPGVCEPLDSPQCQGRNDFVSCELDEFDNCETINRPQVRSTDLRFSRIQVPPTETNYFCMTFDLPTDQDYHLIAYEPLIDNANVMHHILLYGCRDPNGQRLDTPALCGMSDANNDCTEIIGLWAVGVSGYCFPDGLGFRFGGTEYSRVRFEAHYNNPELRSDYTDASGLRLYYQPAQPQYEDLYTFMIGQRLLAIPPGEPRVEAVGVCPGDCTRAVMNKPAYIISGINHMHYLGRSMKIEIFRDGKLYRTVTNEDYYSYDNPIEHKHDPFIEILPGDEIKTTCVFNSLSSDRHIYYGDGTQDEMCFGFLQIYPKDALPAEASCVSLGAASACDVAFGTPVGNCDWKVFTNGSHPDTKGWWQEVDKNCNLDGFCRPECKEISERVKNHPCLKGPASSWVNYVFDQFHEGTALRAKLHSCNSEDSAKDCADCMEYCPTDDVRDSATGSAAAGVVTFFALLAVRVFGY